MTRSLLTSGAIALLALAATMAVPDVASARTQATLSYRYDKVWPAVVRFLRIDERLRITEKDLDAGYVLFELEEDGATFVGSVELARVRDQERRNASLIVIHIEDRPAYMEQGLIDRLEIKLRRELGEPREPPPPPKKKPAPAPKKPRNDGKGEGGDGKPKASS